MGAVETGNCKERSIYVIEPMQVDDVPEVMDIERSSFSNPWSREAFVHEITRNAHSFPTVARTTYMESTTVAGYCVRWLVFEHLHIQNVAVHPRHRRCGLGRHLIEDALQAGIRAGASKALLEVRESNHAAQLLYESMGFRKVGRRKNYYRRPLEDAILYEKELRDEGS